jgi:UDP-N-acetylmuramoylalanine--D-glutamate ligase
MNKNALIIGFGASGKSAACLLETRGYQVYVYDDKNLDSSFEQLSIDDIQQRSFDLGILSPGVDPKHEVLRTLKDKDIPIRGEADFALSFLPQRKIGITGTNGKTTVTYLCEHILKVAGFNAVACGNVSKDKALSQIALNCPPEAVLCVELSSFQLETLNVPCFETGIILNITPDHLDRYDGMQEYAKSKFRLRNLSENFYVFKEVTEQFKELQSPTDMTYSMDLEDSFLGLSFDSFIDKVNLYSAYLLLKSFKLSDKIFVDAFKTFKKPKHRLEKVASLEGIDFINDSKATNIDATIQALRSINKPVILLAGGVDKGHPYAEWIPYLTSVKKIICFGSSQQIIYSQLASYIPCELVSSLQEAVTCAYSHAIDGDVVLLSPGCSSFDEFKDYQDRGEKFCQNVHNLKPKETFL